MEHLFSMQVARGFILHNKKKLFTAHTFLLTLCRRPYPLPSDLFAFFVGGCVHAHASAPCARRSHVGGCGSWISAAELMLWVIVGHGFLMTHNDPRGKVANFLHSVCGSCGSSWRHFSIAPNTEPYTNLTTHKQNLSY